MVVALALAVCLVAGYRVGVGIERARHMLERAERIPHPEPVEPTLRGQDLASVSNLRRRAISGEGERAGPLDRALRAHGGVRGTPAR